jgi:hypothetical protein
MSERKRKANDKPDPTALLRQTFAQYQQLQSQLAQLQIRLLTIVEVAGMSSTEANEVLGTEFYAEQEEPATDDSQ